MGNDLVGGYLYGVSLNYRIIISDNDPECLKNVTTHSKCDIAAPAKFLPDRRNGIQNMSPSKQLSLL